MYFRVNHRTFIALIGIAGAALLALAACSGDHETQAAGERRRPAVPVAVDRVVQKDVPLTVDAVGNVESFASVSVKSRVSGPIVAVHFQDGQDVREGDPLFTIDPLPAQAALKQAQAQLARNQALARKAQTDLKRNTALAEKGVVSAQEYDQLKAEAEALDAAIRADQAAIENLTLQLKYCDITAPISGRTGNIVATRGTLVKANDDNKYLVAINQIQPIYVTFTVPEKFLGQVRRAMDEKRLTADVRTPADPEDSNPLTGQVTFVDNSVDAATGTIRLKATFANDRRNLWPGQFVTVRLNLHVDAGALVVPAHAVQTGQDGRFVFVVGPDDKVELRPVTVARTTAGDAIIAAGLKPGETVVTDGHLSLVPGAQVVVKDGRPDAERTTR